MSDNPDTADETKVPASAVPRHVAIIMDGNGRWARRRRLPRIAGHRAGVESVRAAVRVAVRRGVSVLTLFAFSSENWARPAEEVGMLMELFFTALQREVRRLKQNNVRLRIVGDTSRFDSRLQEQIVQAERQTAANDGLRLNVAANYGGRWDITEAARELAREVAAGELEITGITPERLAGHLSLAGLPDPDLFIRTGGEKRISNFLLWQLAYSELYFTDVCWPDFGEEAFGEALDCFGQRERRFGRTSEQIDTVDDA